MGHGRRRAARTGYRGRHCSRPVANGRAGFARVRQEGGHPLRSLSPAPFRLPENGPRREGRGPSSGETAVTWPACPPWPSHRRAWLPWHPSPPCPWLLSLPSLPCPWPPFRPSRPCPSPPCRPSRPCRRPWRPSSPSPRPRRRGGRRLRRFGLRRRRGRRGRCCRLCRFAPSQAPGPPQGAAAAFAGSRLRRRRSRRGRCCRLCRFGLRRGCGAGGQLGRAAQAEIALDLVERRVADALDVLDVVDRLERAVGLAVIDDRLGLDRADAVQCLEFFLGGRVDVDGRERQAREDEADDQQQEPFHEVSPGHVSERMRRPVCRISLRHSDKTPGGF